MVDGKADIFGTMTQMENLNMVQYMVNHIAKIASALNIPLAQLFEKLGDGDVSDSIPLKCYEFLSAKTKTEQEHLYRMLVEMDKYKNK